MSQENHGAEGGTQGFCPAHFEIVKEVSTTTAKIDTLTSSHDRLCNTLETLRNDIKDRMPGRVVALITVLSSGFVGLLCIVITHFLSSGPN